MVYKAPLFLPFLCLVVNSHSTTPTTNTTMTTTEAYNTSSFPVSYTTAIAEYQEHWCCGPDCCLANATEIDDIDWEFSEEEREDMKVHFVRDMSRTVKWTKLFIVYDEEHEMTVKKMTSAFSGILYQLARTSPDGNDTYIIHAIMDIIMATDSLDALIVCSAECIHRVLQMAISLETEFKRRVSIVKSTKWLLVPSGEENARVFDKIFSLGFDNIGVVSTPRLLAPEFQASMFSKCLPLVVSTLLWKAGKRRELSPVGHYCKDSGAIIMSNIFPNTNFGFNGRHFLVSTLTWDGYMMKEDVNGTTHYYGLCADLLDELARTLNFTYTYTEPADGVWGHNNSGVWTGLVGQLNRQEVDMTMAPLTVSKERETAMDFTYPFYHDFTGVLLKRPDPNATKWRTYIDIFRWQVLMCLGLAVFGASVVGIVIDMAERYIFNKRNLWISFNRFWVILGALLQQGCRSMPRRGSGRMFLSAWWLFSIILAATYSANLIAFLTVTKDKAPFDTLEEMVNQDDYTYGTIDESVWTMLFAGSHTPTYKAIHENIQRFKQGDPRVLSTDTNAHLEHVKEGGYAYIADMGLFQYWLATNCDLMVIKEKFFPARYGAGLPDNSAYTKLFSDQIMKIYENGLMGVWIKRWWPKRSFCGGSLTTEARALTLLDTQSVFYLTGVGFVIAAVFLGGEYGYSFIRPRAPEPPQSLAMKPNTSRGDAVTEVENDLEQ